MATVKVFYIPDVVDKRDIVFSKIDNFQKQANAEMRNPVFKRNKSKKIRK